MNFLDIFTFPNDLISVLKSYFATKEISPANLNLVSRFKFNEQLNVTYNTQWGHSHAERKSVGAKQNIESKKNF